MAGKLLLINASRRRHRKAGSSKRRRARRSKRAVNPFFALRRPTHHKRRRHAKRRASSRRRNPSARMPGGGFLRALVPMTTDAAMGAAGSLAIDWLWGQVNPRLPANLQSVPGRVGLGDAVKVAGTVLVGTTANRMTRGFSMRAARGALTVQLERVIRAWLPATVQQQLAYVGPAPVTQGTWWTGPNRLTRGVPMGSGMPMGQPKESMAALQRPGGRTPLLNGMAALQRPGGRTPLLNQAPAGLSRAGGFR